jgi:Isochorismatase family
MGARIEIAECRTMVVNADKSNDFPLGDSSQLWLKELAASDLLPVYFVAIEKFLESEINACFSKFTELTRGETRHRLLVLGAHLEDSITLIALEALAQGYDVYLPGDLIVTSNKQLEKFHWERLFQAGSVPTTMAQILVEWLSREPDSDISHRIRKLSAQFNTMQS